jgi:hypothetical protein
VIRRFAAAAGSLWLLAVAVSADVLTSTVAMVFLLALLARREEARRA